MTQPVWVVLKFGGTSVKSRAGWRCIVELIERRRAENTAVVVVCSALSGVTDLLERYIAKQLSVTELHTDLLSRHQEFATQLGVDADALIEARLALIKSYRQSETPDYPGQAELLALGELLCTEIASAFLSQQSIEHQWLDARQVLCAELERDAKRHYLSARCSTQFGDEVSEASKNWSQVVLTQGFIARNEQQETVLLGRGGSDTSAAYFAALLKATRLEIWTDVPGFFSADPNSIPQARLLPELNYAEALEMTASGAQVVHPRCIKVARDSALPVWLGCTYATELGGTLIHSAEQRCAAVRAITFQADMAVIHLENQNIRRQVGFLAWVFEVFTRYRLSIDQVATSETTTTLSLNLVENHISCADLQPVITTLAERCKVDFYSSCVCVNVVGSEVRKALPELTDALQHFTSHQLLMLSHSASDVCLSFILPKLEATEFSQRLHRHLITESGSVDSVYGQTWQALQEKISGGTQSEV